MGTNPSSFFIENGFNTPAALSFVVMSILGACEDTSNISGQNPIISSTFSFGGAIQPLRDPLTQLR
jgi:hypothetical protein